jgi:hypothetical protein
MIIFLLLIFRRELTATSVGNQLFFAGGYTAVGASNVVDIYNGGSWTTATLSIARYIPVSTTVGSTALFAGGISASGSANNVDIYYGGTWKTATLSLGRYYLIRNMQRAE